MVGIQPSEFWTMTPYQLNLCVDAYQNKEISEKNNLIRLAYSHMTLMRMDAKRLPKVEKLLIGFKKTVPAFDENAIIAQMKAYNAKLEQEGTK